MCSGCLDYNTIPVFMNNLIIHYLLTNSFCTHFWFKGALTYFLGCVAKEYICGITWKFFATHRSFYNTALAINIEIEQ